MKLNSIFIIILILTTSCSSYKKVPINPKSNTIYINVLTNLYVENLTKKDKIEIQNGKIINIIDSSNIVTIVPDSPGITIFSINNKKYYFKSKVIPECKIILIGLNYFSKITINEFKKFTGILTDFYSFENVDFSLNDFKSKVLEYKISRIRKGEKIEYLIDSYNINNLQTFNSIANDSKIGDIFIISEVKSEIHTKIKKQNLKVNPIFFELVE